MAFYSIEHIGRRLTNRDVQYTWAYKMNGAPNFEILCAAVYPKIHETHETGCLQFLCEGEISYFMLNNHPEPDKILVSVPDSWKSIYGKNI